MKDQFTFRTSNLAYPEKRMNVALPRIPLTFLPTPLSPAPSLSKRLGGPRILIKRDDLAGLGQGGGKARKLEYILGDALSQGADCVLTAGMPQSNHCLQTAAAAAKCGLECHLVIGSPTPVVPTGNLLLDSLLGVKLHWTSKSTRENHMEEVFEKLRAQGRNPYLIPIGGSNSLGTLGYVDAMNEIVNQLKSMNESVDHIVFGTSSGGTQAGLVVGSKLCEYPAKILGISIDQLPDEESEVKYQAFVTEIANGAAQLLSLDQKVLLEDVQINYDYLGAGYGIVGELEREAIRTLAQTEGILLGPVYSGRAFGGFLDLVKKGYFQRDETVLFWHTGGASVLPMYPDELLAK